MTMIYLSKPFFDHEELDAIKETFDSGWVAGQGPRGAELSKYVTSRLNVKHAIPLNNCTAGLHLALLALGIKSGDEVIVSDYTFPATGHAVLYCGATPRFADVRLDSYNVDPSKIEEKITSQTKAIIVVHAFGLMAEMPAIKKIAAAHGLKIIEDAACAMGAKYGDANVGSFGDITCFSMHGRKNATSGEGGINITNSDAYAETMTSLSCFGMRSAFQRQSAFEIPSFQLIGYNYKLSDINSAIALVQLKRYPAVLAKKRSLVRIYDSLLANNKFVTSPAVQKDLYHVYQSYVVQLHKEIDRNELIVSLREDGIQSQIGTYASHIQPVYQSKDVCPNSRSLYDHSIALPLYYDLTEDKIPFVVECLTKRIQNQLSRKRHG